MNSFKQIIKHKEHRLGWLHFLTAAFFIIALVFFFLPFVMQLIWVDTVYPGVRVSVLELGKLNQTEAHELLQKKINNIETTGYEFVLSKNQVVVFPLITAPGDPDLTYELIHFDIEQIFNQAMLVGRQGGRFDRWLTVYQSFFSITNIPVYYDLNKESLIEILHSNFINEEVPARDAGFAYEAGELRIVADKVGQVIDYQQAIGDLEDQLKLLSNEPINLKIVNDQPVIEYKSVASLQSQAKDFLERTPINLQAKYLSKQHRINWQQNIDRATAAAWLAPVINGQGVELGFGEGLTLYLEEQSTNINQEPLDAKFEISNGRIIQFQASRDGIIIDVASSTKLMQNLLLQEEQNEIRLVLTVVPPRIVTSEVNDLGINEIIGIGKSDFSGSPSNRRKNIKIASDKLNGLLIKPSEEFSLVEALRPFTQEAGYLPELVIKGNRLIPEVGGGACQIGTTAFRTALDSGLEISQRRNHSFAVSYYNDENGLPGTDATIYDPLPDFRFVNNTPGHILIQTFVGEDSILTYEFWGTNDGRQASTTIPVISSRTPAPDTKYIETEDLEPGVTECTGSNVPGYSTYFKYSIADENGEYSEKYFNSKYKPWQRVCLIGIEPEETEEEPEE